MTLLAAYATAAQYRAAVGDKGTGTDMTLDAQLAGTSRLLERSLLVAPGGFNSVTASARVFDGFGEPVLWLRDRAGFGYFLQTIDADSLKIDLTLDGSYDDYTLDLADVWVRGLPENAAAHSEPFRAIELRPMTTATITVFPKLPGCIQITGTWGWAAVPDMITNLVIHRTHELREGLKAGAMEALSSFDAAVPMQPNTAWQWREAERLYGRKMPVIA